MKPGLPALLYAAPNHRCAPPPALRLAFVPPVSQPAVPPISQSADRANIWRVRSTDGLRVGKPAIQQTGKSAVQGSERSGARTLVPAPRPTPNAQSLKPISRSAFTLIEVMIASALMALILVSAYACLSAGYASQKIVEPRTEILQNARVALALMTADLRAACPLSPDAQFIGATRMLGEAEADNLDFATHNLTPRHPGEGDYCQESFYVDKDAKTGQLSLWRRRNPRIAPDPLAGGRREELATGLRGFKLEYYDGLDWYASWGEVKAGGRSKTSAAAGGNLSGLPNAVRLTLYLDANPRRTPVRAGTPAAPEPPLVFQTVARLNLAEASQNAATAAGPATGGPATTGAPNPGPN